MKGLRVVTEYEFMEKVCVFNLDCNHTLPMSWSSASTEWFNLVYQIFKALT